MNHRPHLLLLLCLCSILVLSGCEFKDIDKRLFVLAIAIDKAEHLQNGYKVSLKLGIPSGQNKPQKESFQLLTAEQPTITEATERISAMVDKEIDFGHAKALILGKSLVDEDYREALEWLTRQRFIQEIAWIGVGKPSAFDVLEVQPKTEELPANALYLSFGQTGVESQYIVSQRLFEFYRNSKEKGVSPVLPYIEAKDDHYQINQAVVFDEQESILILSPSNTRLLNLLTGSIEKSDFTAQWNKNPVVVHLEEMRVHSTLYTSGTLPTLTMHLKLNGILTEEKGLHQVDQQGLEQIEQSLTRQLSADTKKLLETFQEYQVDPLGFGLTYRSQHMQDPDLEWKQWQGIYPKLKFQVQVQIALHSVGLIQ